jgi:AcrR family transcriptional regulator
MSLRSGYVDQNTRERLLDAASLEAAERGLGELTLTRVGARAGVSRQTMYVHFGNRLTLLGEMARRDDHTSGFRARLTAARAAPPRLAFRRALEEWFDYLPTILSLHRHLEAAALTGEDGADAYLDRMREWREALCLMVVRLADGGDLDPRWDVEAATDWTWAQVHPTTFHHLVDERGWSPEVTASTIIAALERELLTEADVGKVRRSGRQRKDAAAGSVTASPVTAGRPTRTKTTASRRRPPPTKDASFDAATPELAPASSSRRGPRQVRGAS